jgi:hypothetical protein
MINLVIKQAQLSAGLVHFANDQAKSFVWDTLQHVTSGINTLDQYPRTGTRITPLEGIL